MFAEMARLNDQSERAHAANYRLLKKMENLPTLLNENKKIIELIGDIESYRDEQKKLINTQKKFDDLHLDRMGRISEIAEDVQKRSAKIIIAISACFMLCSLIGSLIAVRVYINNDLQEKYGVLRILVCWFYLLIF